MARIARIVAPGVPHHVTQRGNRSQPTFLVEDDYALYRDLVGTWLRRYRIETWAWCLMPNHVHLILVPPSADALRQALGEAHRRYTVALNRREGWRGHLWQGRFASFALDREHLLAAARHIELNPVRARLVTRPEDWPWSSARAHLSGQDNDRLTRTAPLLAEVGDWRTFLSLPEDPDEQDRLRRHERTGRPLGDAAFMAGLEARLGRALGPRRPGRRPRGAGAA